MAATLATFVARLTGRLAVAHEDVLDVGRVELGDLGEHVGDGERREVVGTTVHERSLVGPADRRAPGRDDDCLCHVPSSESSRA